MDIPAKDWPIFSVKLHPQLVAFLEAKSRKSGRAIETEVQQVVGDAMELAEIPPPTTNSKFQCSEELMVEKAECQDCGDQCRHNARLWGQRHVQLTGHKVVVSLHYDLRDGDWLEKLSPERRTQLDELRDGETARALAQSLLVGVKH